jgi:hypothetical protein
VEVRVGKEGAEGMEVRVRVGAGAVRGAKGVEGEDLVVEGEVGVASEVKAGWEGRALGMEVKVLAGLVVMELQGSSAHRCPCSGANWAACCGDTAIITADAWQIKQPASLAPAPSIGCAAQVL